MTEAGTQEWWHDATSPEPLLEWLEQDRRWQRKMRLFAAASCRRVWSWMRDSRSERAVKVAEDCADGLLGAPELADARKHAREARENWLPLDQHWHNRPLEEQDLGEAIRNARWASEHALDRDEFQAARGAVEAVSSCAAWVARLAAGLSVLDAVRDEVANAGFEEEERQLVRLLRHIVGDPFVRASAPENFTAAVRDLAAAVYQGEAFVFALHDVLVEAGHADLAEHFRDPNERHPKGCFVLDLLLSKE